MKRFFSLCIVLWILNGSLHIIRAQWVQTAATSNGKISAIIVKGTKIFAGTWGDGVFLSGNYGDSWTAINTGLVNKTVASLAVTDSFIFAGTASGGLFRSTIADTVWTAVNSGLTNEYIWSLAAHSTSLFAGTWGGVFFSSDNGLSWTQVNTGLTNTTIFALALIPSQEGTDGWIVFAGTEGRGVFLSTNNGTNWTAVSTGVINTPVYSLVASDTNLIAGTNGDGVYITTNHGTSWTQVNSGLTNTTIRSLAVDTAGDGARLFAGTDGGGVFLSTDNGTNWTAVNTGLIYSSVYSLAVSPSGGATDGSYLFAGTNYSGGVWRRPLPEMTTSIRRTDSDVPAEFTLEQNYPNPFNPSTTIKFSLPHADYVHLEVFNSVGERIAELISKNMNAGTYSIQWNASQFPSGVYFYRLRSGSFCETKKNVLLK